MTCPPTWRDTVPLYLISENLQLTTAAVDLRLSGHAEAVRPDEKRTTRILYAH